MTTCLKQKQKVGIIITLACTCLKAPPYLLFLFRFTISKGIISPITKHPDSCILFKLLFFKFVENFVVAVWNTLHANAFIFLQTNTCIQVLYLMHFSQFVLLSFCALNIDAGVNKVISYSGGYSRVVCILHEICDTSTHVE